ncbi:MAG TPA: hypothetical protein VGQ81_09570 [Acidobacteriota bacterium]|jgi:hypothetical protein|nr:hypothetical protein [Acidobacteriota bacterium]
MTTSASDFDAAKAVADQLIGMEKERQQRILRWVAENLGLNLGGPAAAERRTEGADAGGGGTSSADQGGQAVYQRQRSADIKTFVDLKKPKSDVQFAAVVAYYYRFEAPAESRRGFMDAQVLQEAIRRARSPSLFLSGP